MASDLSFVTAIVERLLPECEAGFKKMFGEYGIYCRGKMVAMVCDNRFLVKATDEGRAYIGDYVEAEPYPGAKPALLITDKLDDVEWLSDLLLLSEKVLPAPKPKKKKPR